MAVKWLPIFFVLAAGCSSQAFDYAKARNPNCEVTQIDENSESVVVWIQCPGEKAFQRVYKKH